VILRTGAPLSVLAVAAAISAAACSSSNHSSAGIRIFDPAGRIHKDVRSKDVSSATVISVSGQSGVALVLTRSGAKGFHELTRRLAERGARLHRNTHFAFAVDGRVYATPYVDYRLYPQGLDGSSGIEVANLPASVAQEVAREIRKGHKGRSAAAIALPLRRVLPRPAELGRRRPGRLRKSGRHPLRALGDHRARVTWTVA